MHGRIQEESKGRGCVKQSIRVYRSGVATIQQQVSSDCENDGAMHNTNETAAATPAV